MSLVTAQYAHDPSRRTSEFRYRVDQALMLRRHEDAIEKEIVRITSEQLAQDFMMQHGVAIMRAISHEAVVTAITEAVVSRLMNQLKRG